MHLAQQINAHLGDNVLSRLATASTSSWLRLQNRIEEISGLQAPKSVTDCGRLLLTAVSELIGIKQGGFVSEAHATMQHVPIVQLCSGFPLSGSYLFFHHSVVHASQKVMQDTRHSFPVSRLLLETAILPLLLTCWRR